MPSRKRHFFTAAGWMRRFVVVVASASLLALAAVLVWARQVVPADATAHFALDSDDIVLVSKGDWITFRPRDSDPTIGLVFYPGGKAESAAYAPVLRRLAERGFLVVVTPMPLNLAMLAPNRAEAVMARFPTILRWVIGGHSLGGVMAAEFAERHAEQLAGLTLWASYPAEFTDLSQSSLPVLSLYGTEDDLATVAKVEQARSRLPTHTVYVSITGGDHWNFGDFAAGSGTARIPRYEQQALALDATQAFLEKIGPAPADSEEPP
jgi:pimeloyl-ACP methyl ester carboxylesterase